MIKKIIDKSKLISLEEESHTYSLLNSDLKFKSVTEFIHTFFKPFDEQKIAKKLTQTNLKYKGMSVEQLINSWNKRRDRGTIVHKQIEDFVNSECKISDAEMNNLDLKTIQGINFINKKCLKKTNLLASEVIIYSEELKLAGTIDLIIFNKEKNHVSIIDWKTSSIVLFAFIFFSSLIFAIVKGRLYSLGKNLTFFQSNFLKKLLEAFNNIKFIKIRKLESFISRARKLGYPVKYSKPIGFKNARKKKK